MEKGSDSGSFNARNFLFPSLLLSMQCQCRNTGWHILTSVKQITEREVYPITLRIFIARMRWLGEECIFFKERYFRFSDSHTMFLTTESDKMFKILNNNQGNEFSYQKSEKDCVFWTNLCCISDESMSEIREVNPSGKRMCTQISFEELIDHAPMFVLPSKSEAIPSEYDVTAARALIRRNATCGQQSATCGLDGQAAVQIQVALGAMHFYKWPG